MKRRWLLAGILVSCLVISSCGKKQEEKTKEETGEETIIYGKKECSYEYSYEQKKDGSFDVLIEGEWEDGWSWEVDELAESVVSVKKEKEEGNKEKKVVFLVSPCATGGYSQIDFVLKDTAAQEKKYTIRLLAMLDGNGSLELSESIYREEKDAE